MRRAGTGRSETRATVDRADDAAARKVTTSKTGRLAGLSDQILAPANRARLAGDASARQRGNLTDTPAATNQSSAASLIPTPALVSSCRASVNETVRPPSRL